MVSVNFSKGKLNKVLMDMEVLIQDVALLLNQDEITKRRLSEIKRNPSIALSEEDLNDYLEKRGG